MEFAAPCFRRAMIDPRLLTGTRTEGAFTESHIVLSILGRSRKDRMATTITFPPNEEIQRVRRVEGMQVSALCFNPHEICGSSSTLYLGEALEIKGSKVQSPESSLRIMTRGPSSRKNALHRWPRGCPVTRGTSSRAARIFI